MNHKPILISPEVAGTQHGDKGHSAPRLYGVVHWKQFRELLDEHEEAEFLDALINSLRAATKTARAAPFQLMADLKLLNLHATPSALTMPRPGQLPTSSTKYCADRVGPPSAPLQKAPRALRGRGGCCVPSPSLLLPAGSPSFPRPSRERKRQPHSWDPLFMSRTYFRPHKIFWGVVDIIFRALGT